MTTPPGQQRPAPPGGLWTAPPAGLEGLPGHPHAAQPWAPSSRPSRRNGFAVAALVLGICGGVVLGAVFGLVALYQIRRTGQRGHGMAVAGVVLSAAWTLLVVLGLVGALLGGPQRDRRSDPDTVGPGDTGDTVRIDDLRVGDCLGDLDEGGSVLSVSTVPCGEPHEGEVFAVFDLPDGPYPGEEGVGAAADEECSERLADYSPEAFEDPDVGLYRIYPRARNWRVGDREVICIASADAGPRRGPLPR